MLISYEGRYGETKECQNSEVGLNVAQNLELQRRTNEEIEVSMSSDNKHIFPYFCFTILGIHIR